MSVGSNATPVFECFQLSLSCSELEQLHQALHYNNSTIASDVGWKLTKMVVEEPQPLWGPELVSELARISRQLREFYARNTSEQFELLFPAEAQNTLAIALGRLARGKFDKLSPISDAQKLHFATPDHEIGADLRERVRATPCSVPTLPDRLLSTQALDRRGAGAGDSEDVAQTLGLV